MNTETFIEAEADTPTVCPMCGSYEANTLGTLGRLTWFRCRDCGWDYVEKDA